MNANNNALGAALLLLLAVGCVIIVGVIVLKIFFCLTLQRTMSEVRPRNRTIPAGLVWLHLLHFGGFVPFIGFIFGIVAGIWDLIMVLKIGSSLKQEFEDRGWSTEGESYGRLVGLIWTIGHLATTPVGLAMNFLGSAIGDPSVVMAIGVAVLGLWLVGFVCWIVYWVQTAGYGRRLRERSHRYRSGSVEEDFDDEFRPPRHHGDDDDFDDDGPPRRRDPDDGEGRGFDFNRGRRRRDDEFDDDADRPRRRGRDDD